MIEIMPDDPLTRTEPQDEDDRPEWCEDCDMPKASCMCRFLDIDPRPTRDAKVTPRKPKAVSSPQEEEEFDKLIQSASTPTLASLFARGVRTGVLTPQIAGSGGQ